MPDWLVAASRFCHGPRRGINGSRLVHCTHFVRRVLIKRTLPCHFVPHPVRLFPGTIENRSTTNLLCPSLLAPVSLTVNPGNDARLRKYDNKTQQLRSCRNLQVLNCRASMKNQATVFILGDRLFVEHFVFRRDDIDSRLLTPA